jgi:hypothetical protein
MPSISESLGSQNQLQETLAAGLNTLSNSQTVQFTQYSKSTIPTDGFVFYVNTGSVTTVQGSLHYAINQQQNEDETIDVNRVVFTALSQIDVFNQAAPDDLFIGEFEGIQFSFSSRGSFYQQANLYHYVGNAVYPALASQLIDSAADLPVGPIVSNSLPIWLGLPSQAAAYAPFGYAPIYPSFLVPDNVVPPYIAVHIDPAQTITQQAMPYFDWSARSNPNGDPSPLYEVPSFQLMRDTVKLIFYGFTNQQAIQFNAALMDYSVNSDDFGFGNSPAIVDDKRTQVEIAALAMKKTYVIQASYNSGTSDAIARRLILEAGFSSFTTS